MKKLRILIVGGGGREHALYETTRKSSLVDRVFVAPGNAGVAELDRYELNLSGSADEINDIVFELAHLLMVDLVVIGPEKPLVGGVVDHFAARGSTIKVFGPTKVHALLEGSKVYFKYTCRQLSLPTASFRVAKSLHEAELNLVSHYRQWNEPPVIKADGLAGGKGVVVAESLSEARDTLDSFIGGLHGEAGKVVVIERRLVGRECSFMVLADGQSVIPLLPSRDYKRLSTEPGAPNTGGMGAYAPLPDVPQDGDDYVLMLNHVKRLVRLTGYRGLLYAGFMLTRTGPVFLEVNCRFGDPETQVVLPMLDCDIVPALLASCEERGFDKQAVQPLMWKAGYAVGVSMTAAGYPAKPKTGSTIYGIAEALKLDMVRVFEAGTEWKDGQKVTSGGRVLTVVGTGKTLTVAQSCAYAGAHFIRWEGEYHRGDIAYEAIVNEITKAGP